MVSTISAIRDVFNVIVGSGFMQEVVLTGAVYIANRPLNSKLEDVVISSIAMNAKSLQEGVFNVNIHVPNVELKKAGSQPNIDRFDELTKALIKILSDVWGANYNFIIEDPGSLIPDGDQWFCNIRIRYWTLRDVA